MAGRKRGVGRLIVGVGLMTALVASAAARPAGASAVERLPVLEALRPEIDFWKAIFSVYTTQQAVFHDTENLGRIYGALDFSELKGSGLSPGQIEARRRQAVSDEIERLRALLVTLHARRHDPTGLTKEERRIVRLFASDPNPNAMLLAAEEKRVRAQGGLRDRFHRGLEISRAYLPTMERIFREHGLPLELTRMPFVESTFDVRAYSRVGAAGVWQFMPATGRLYMRVDSLVDERRDPIAATRAAARHLKADYDFLGNWPLAVTAYNHGRGGMARAAKELGTGDLVKIVKSYRGPSFGFASRNFYVEVLAAIEVVREAEKHFGPIQGEPEIQYDTARLPSAMSFSSLARAARVDRATLAGLNPALARVVVAGNRSVPRGYELRLPVGSRTAVERQLRTAAAAPAKVESRRPKYVRHRVKRGQTLSSIARRYRTTVERIRKHNRLTDPDHVPAGRTLVIPLG